MNLKTLSKEKLVENTKTIAVQERKLQLELIEHLQEIYSRRLHLEMGYPSLHEFVVKELGYSDGAAHRRISAMKLSEEVPEVKAYLQEGSLNLSTAATIQRFLKTEKVEDKRALVEELKHKSSKEVESHLAGLSPKFAREKVRAVSATELEITLIADPELQELLKRVEELKGKQKYADLLKLVLKDYVKKHDPLQQKMTHPQLRREALPKSRYIPEALRRFIWQRDQGRCTYKKDGRQCTAKHRLEIEHLLPYAYGGEHTAQNLTLRCKAHNLLAARKLGFSPS